MSKKWYYIGGAVIIGAIGGFLYWNNSQQIPAGLSAINNFQSERYLGKWYEIARTDNRFERNLDNVTANYSLNNDGSIKVINRGWNYLKKEWEQAEGKAKFAGKPNEGMLKVSFWAPIYSGYNVIEIDTEYKYALVIGNSLDYMWILSRETTIPEEYLKRYIKTAKDAGIAVEQLIFPKHNMN